MRASGRAALAAVALLAVLETGCIVHITREASPTAAFARAREEAVRFADREGRASELNLLAWDPDERKLVRVSVPLWLVRSADRHVDVELDPEYERWRRKMGKLRWEDIERAGPGILLEVLEDEGDRVLVWLR